MRFRNLKIVVGVFLVLFILVVANTLIFGLVQKEMAAALDKGSGSRVASLAEGNRSGTSSANDTVNNSADQPVSTPPPAPPASTPVTPPPRTRAS